MQDETFEPLGHLKHLSPRILPAVSLLTAEATVAVSTKELCRAIVGAGNAQRGEEPAGSSPGTESFLCFGPFLCSARGLAMQEVPQSGTHLPGQKL